MKGHEIRALRRSQFPLDVLVPADATIVKPTRGPHDDWATDFIHAGACCTGPDRVPFDGVTPETHTDYIPCPHTHGSTRDQLTLAHTVAQEHARAFDLLDTRQERARDALGRPDDLDHLADAGWALYELADLQWPLFADVRSQVRGANAQAAGAVEVYLAAREQELSTRCTAFAARWWPALTDRPPATRLTFLRTDRHDRRDKLASAMAGDLQARGAHWFVVITPRLTDQLWWDEEYNDTYDLGPASSGLPAGAWDTFAQMCESLDPREAFAALCTATQD